MSDIFWKVTLIQLLSIETSVYDIFPIDWPFQKMEKIWQKLLDRDWTRDLPRGLKSRASHSVQGLVSPWVAERLHTV